ncbi:membrane-associated progesterone receptor component 1 [Diaporthe eres]|uniref:Cytochrome b5 heme-binding domain-containing protein n=1 Tax=Diaporthe vaccinii TaxID=105482 RepID=A0ABR4EFW7_9PEZI|nr:membrane-associated progesterone receptor component 1 [Diaporthe eres]
MDYVEQRMAQEAQRAAQAAHSNALLTPLNVILLLLLGYTLYGTLKPSPPPLLPKEPPATVFRTFTPRTLLPFDGRDGRPIYFAVRGRVFDVSTGRNFYGPDGPYENFAGRDASRGLASGSFDEEVLTKDLDGPLDSLESMGPDEMEALRDWEEQFLSKYLVVGRLVPVGQEDKPLPGRGNGM